jgi:hypothetical protein
MYHLKRLLSVLSHGDACLKTQLWDFQLSSESTPFLWREYTQLEKIPFVNDLHSARYWIHEEHRGSEWMQMMEIILYSCGLSGVATH